MNTIQQAVQPLRSMAEEQATKQALAQIERVIARFEESGWDLDVAAPRPNTGVGKAEYRRRLAIHHMFSGLTTYTKSVLRHGEPNIRARSPEAEARFVKAAVEAAVASYDAYVAKLVAKIGEATEAKLEVLGGVWGHSYLHVVVSGVAQTWKTQMILNYSGLGTPYNQWPTRLVK